MVRANSTSVNSAKRGGRDKPGYDNREMMSATLSGAKTGTAVMCERMNGAQGRNRTTDTAIFSRMLYQLSYLGTSSPPGTWERGFIVRLACPVHHAEARPRHASRTAKRRQNASIGVFVRVLASGNGVGIRQPAVQIHVPAALRTKRTRFLLGRLAADRARLLRSLGRAAAGAGVFWRLSWHSTTRIESGNLRRRAA